MSSAAPNCCHIEQFKHLICAETHPERNCKSTGRLRRTLTWVFLLRTAASQEEADVPQCVATWVRCVPRGRCVLLKNEASVRVRALPHRFTFQHAGCGVAAGSLRPLNDGPAPACNICFLTTPLRTNVETKADSSSCHHG